MNRVGSSRESKDPDAIGELRRMFVMAVFACVLLGLSAFFDGPVSLTGWLLFGAGFLCLVYILFASRMLIRMDLRTRPDRGKSESPSPSGPGLSPHHSPEGGASAR